MLQNTLVIVEKRLGEETKLTNNKIKELLEFLKKYKLNRIVYPGVITREVGIDMEQTYKALKILVDNKYLEKNYEVYCHNCRRFDGIKIYRSLAAVPDDLSCDECDSDLNKLEDTVQIFRVIRNVE